MTPTEALEDLWGMLSLNYDSKIERAWAARAVLESLIQEAAKRYGAPHDPGDEDDRAR